MHRNYLGRGTRSEQAREIRHVVREDLEVFAAIKALAFSSLRRRRGLLLLLLRSVIDPDAGQVFFAPPR